MTRYSNWLENKAEYQNIDSSKYRIDQDKYEEIEADKKKLEALHLKIKKIEQKRSDIFEAEIVKQMDISIYEDVYVYKDGSEIFRLADGTIIKELPEESHGVDLGYLKRDAFSIIMGYDVKTDELYIMSYSFAIDTRNNSLEKKLIGYEKVSAGERSFSGLLLGKVAENKIGYHYTGHRHSLELSRTVDSAPLFFELLGLGVQEEIAAASKGFDLNSIPTADFEKLKKAGYLHYVLSSMIASDIEYSEFVKMSDVDEIIKAFDWLETQKDEFKFYEITAADYRISGRFGDNDYEISLLTLYFKLGFNKVMAFEEYVKTTVEILFNQGYKSIAETLRDMNKYLFLSKEHGLDTDVHVPQLKQAIKTVEANYRINIEDDLSKYYDGFKKLEHDEYIITFPKTSDELRKDGSVLSYSVASEYNAIEKGKSLTFFLRKKEDVPYVKFAIKNGKIDNIKCVYDEELEKGAYDAICWFKMMI